MLTSRQRALSEPPMVSGRAVCTMNGAGQCAPHLEVAPRSLAFFGTRQGDLLSLFAQAAAMHLQPHSVLALVRSEKVARALRRDFGKHVAFDWADYDAVGLHRVPINFSAVRTAILKRFAIQADPRKAIIVLEMTWGLDTASATANFEN